jgi:ATP-dependent DNA ligase
VVGQGKAFYAAAVARGQEGVMAKHLAAPYRPGRRAAAWRKIKPPPA